MPGPQNWSGWELTAQHRFLRDHLAGKQQSKRNSGLIVQLCPEWHSSDGRMCGQLDTRHCQSSGKGITILFPKYAANTTWGPAHLAVIPHVLFPVQLWGGF